MSAGRTHDRHDDRWGPATRVLLHPASPAAAAIVIRAGLAVWWGMVSTPLTFETEKLVRSMFEGRGYVHRFLGADYHSFHSTVPYDLLYAGVYGLGGGSPAANLVVQWLFAALLCVAVWHIGMRLSGPVVAGLGAWLAAIHPALVVYDATRLIQFNFDATLVAGAVLAFARWAERPSFARAAGAGAIAALLMYERGTMGLFFPVALLWVKRASGLAWRQWARQIALYGAIVILLLSPWFIRNAIIQRRFLPMMSITWFALWQGNNDAATGTEYTADGMSMRYAYPPEMARRLQGADELGQMAVFREAALSFIRSEPARAAELYVRKLVYFWWRSPATGYMYPGWWAVAYQLWYVPFIACAILGFAVLARGDPGSRALARLLFWLAVCFSAGQAVFYIGGRHRWTIEPILGVLTAAGLHWLWHHWRMRRPDARRPAPVTAWGSP